MAQSEMVALACGWSEVGDASRGGILGTSKVGHGKPEGTSEFWTWKPNNISKVGAI